MHPIRKFLSLLLPGGLTHAAPALDTAARGRCSFESLVEEHCPEDAALRELATIVHGADFDELAIAPECAGLRAISRGFPLVSADDRETLEKSAFLYDALYASLRNRRLLTAR